MQLGLNKGKKTSTEDRTADGKRRKGEGFLQGRREKKKQDIEKKHFVTWKDNYENFVNARFCLSAEFKTRAAAERWKIFSSKLPITFSFSHSSFHSVFSIPFLKICLRQNCKTKWNFSFLCFGFFPAVWDVFWHEICWSNFEFDFQPVFEFSGKKEFKFFILEKLILWKNHLMKQKFGNTKKFQKLL